MKVRPILFSGEMIRAILEDRKTMTRRIAKVTDYGCKDGFITPLCGHTPRKIADHVGYCPYGKIGDRLWVKETHYLYGRWVKNGFNKAGKQKWRFGYEQIKGVMFPDNPPEKICSKRGEIGWFKRPSIFMPRWACRIFLEITKRKVERLQEIMEEDALREGIIPSTIGVTNKTCFRFLWNSINGKKYPWKSNPYVWVISFRRLDK